MQRFSYHIANHRLAITIAKARGKFPDVLLDDWNLRFPMKEPKDEKERLRCARARIDLDSKRTIIMLEISLRNNRLHFVQVPGVHCITGKSEDTVSRDPFAHFLEICRLGFVGGEYCNVAFLGSEPFSRFRDFEYDPLRSHNDRNPFAIQDTIKGDTYRFLLWSGFTDNYSYYPLRSNLGHGEGTVGFCPPEHLDSFVVLATGLDKAQVEARIRFYRATFEQVGVECPQFLSRDTYRPIDPAIITSQTAPTVAIS